LIYYNGLSYAFVVSAGHEDVVQELIGGGADVTRYIDFTLKVLSNN
jgi:(2Fe-2S) ferredoxin